MTLLDELRWRGFVHDATRELAEHLAGGSRTAYCGFDPTAPSLQVGNLMPIMLLAQLQRAGHRPIALMGGGTGLIGDPSGKRSERPLLSKEQIRGNLQRQRDQMARFLNFDPGPASALLLDNAKWLVEQRLVDFLRDIGKHFSVNVMLQKESVQARLEGGLSYTEFSYMLLQSYDFLHLYREQRCTLQVGGSDQWGNITAGVDLIRRVDGGEAHALVAPLITTASGAKFGKSEGESIWLDPEMTSPYKFHQFWLNTDDRDVGSYLRTFTFLSRKEIEQLEGEVKLNPAARVAQRQLADLVTEMVHGKEGMRDFKEGPDYLFGDADIKKAPLDHLFRLSQALPTHVSGSQTVSLVEAMVTSSLANSNGEARRAITAGALYVNLEQMKDPSAKLLPGDWLLGRFLLLRKGKKDYAMLEYKPEQSTSNP
ncbi:MAG TPA: tyrosine--tRNA ligase [Gemmatimonadales bacterium]|nr:tyrosine--tRNA ligase [Gemmatimonadales bacterium]